MRNSNNLNNIKEYRCTCGKLLCKGLLVIGAIEIKCKRCGSLKRFDECIENLQIKVGNPNGVDISKLTKFGIVEHNRKKYVFAVL